MGMTYWAEVILDGDESEEMYVIDGEKTRYENLRRITRHAGREYSHWERVTFHPVDGESFTETCIFLTSGEMQ
jgi:adenosyl cobinamide kinase/adenosyl cobinamide phosphate guanylyltransferase